MTQPDSHTRDSGPPLNILIVYHGLKLGGVDNVVAIQANHWAAHGHAVTLVLFEAPGTDRHYAVDQRVTVESLDLFASDASPWRRLRGMFRRHFALRLAIRRVRPDVVISHVSTVNVRVLLAGLGLGVPVVAMEHTDPARFRLSPLWSLLRRALYPRAARVLVLNDAIREHFAAYLPEHKVVQIPNPMPLPPVADPSARKNTVLYLGRLSEEKGVHVLLQAFSLCGERGWELLVAGDGPQKEELLRLTEQLGLSGRVHFLGAVKDVAPLLDAAGIFVLPSFFEGFPMALTEAMVTGTPALATDTSGARALIRHEENGLLSLVNDAASLAKGLDRLMADRELRLRLGQAALSVRDLVGVDVVMERWTGMLRQLADKGERA